MKSGDRGRKWTSTNHVKDEATSLPGLGTNSTRHAGSRHVRIACDLERPYLHEEDLLIELPPALPARFLGLEIARAPVQGSLDDTDRSYHPSFDRFPKEILLTSQPSAPSIYFFDDSLMIIVI